MMVARAARPPPRFSSNDETMGSTPFGNAFPIASIGAALPPHIEIDRDGGSRASVGGRI
jgi:hypothetical protein